MAKQEPHKTKVIKVRSAKLFTGNPVKQLIQTVIVLTKQLFRYKISHNLHPSPYSTHAHCSSQLMACARGNIFAWSQDRLRLFRRGFNRTYIRCKSTPYSVVHHVYVYDTPSVDLCKALSARWSPCWRSWRILHGATIWLQKQVQ